MRRSHPICRHQQDSYIDDALSTFERKWTKWKSFMEHPIPVHTVFNVILKVCFILNMHVEIQFSFFKNSNSSISSSSTFMTKSNRL